MKWLPETRSSTKPFRSKNWISSRGLTAGSFGILEIQGGNQRFVVGWDGLPMLFEALDVAGDSVLRHFLRFGQRTAVSHATRQRWHNGGNPPSGSGRRTILKRRRAFFMVRFYPI